MKLPAWDRLGNFILPITMEQDTVRSKKRRTRIIVKSGDEYLVLQLKDVVLFCIYGRMVFVFDKNGGKYMAGNKLGRVLDELDEEYFFQVNRRSIVNVNYIRSYRKIENANLKVELTIPDLSGDLTVSHSKAAAFKSWLAEQLAQPIEKNSLLFNNLSLAEQARHQLS